jgi:hypothetical protein
VRIAAVLTGNARQNTPTSSLNCVTSNAINNYRFQKTLQKL